MAVKKRRSYLLLLLVLVSIFALLRFESERQKESSEQISEKKETPQFFLDQAITTYYNQSGKISYQLNSESLEYFKRSDVAQIWNAYFIFYMDDGKTWHSRSDQATLFNEKGDIQLTGNVRAWQPEKTLELTTPSIFISDNRSIAKTDQKVHLKFSAGTSDSIGMKIDLNQERLELLSKVQGIYHAQ